MSAKEKKRLLDSLTEAHLSTRAILNEVNLEIPIHKETGWRARDILGHIATWNREVAKSLRAYHTGFMYLIPDLDEEEVEFNEKAILEQKKLSTQQILYEFERAYDELWLAVADIPTDRFPGDMLFPWGDERGSIIELVEYMIEHAVEHRDEIARALKK
jgi:hypothetical protein